MKPSRTAIILDGGGGSDLVNRLDDTFTGRRYTRWPNPLPRGYRPRPREWMAFVVTRSDNVRYGVVIPEDASEVFRVALWMAEADPSAHLLAWRHLRGGEPVMKYYAQGKPRLKVGPDPDVELNWHVPTTLAFDILSPRDAGLPPDLDAIEELVGTALAPYHTQVRQLGPRDQQIAFLLKDSPLVG